MSTFLAARIRRVNVRTGKLRTERPFPLDKYRAAQSHIMSIVVGIEITNWYENS